MKSDHEQFEEEQRIIAKFTLVICLFSIAVYFFYIWYGWKIDRYEISLVCSLYMIGSLVALVLNLKGKNSLAKVLVIANAAVSVVFTYLTFTIGYSVLTIFFPIALAHIYLFNFEKEKKWLMASVSLTGGIFVSTFLFTRFSFIKVELSDEIARQTDLTHMTVSLVITGFLLVVSVQNKSRANQRLREKQDALEVAISELTDTRDQLIQSEKMASLGLLTAGINHEINNPLNFLVGGLDNIKQLAIENNYEDLEPYLYVFEEGVGRISKIVQSLNHFNYQASSSEDTCYPNSILENCLTILDYQIKGRITVQKDFLPDISINGNSSHLHQVFLNLLANAVQAIQKDGRIEIRTWQDERFVYITVKDSGEGIPEEVKYKIFDPFFTTKEPGVGTGLGLSISYRIIQEHKGLLSFNSEQNKGTEFKVSLPRPT